MSGPVSRNGMLRTILDDPEGTLSLMIEQRAEIATLTAKLAESEKQLAEAMKDAERLNTLEHLTLKDGNHTVWAAWVGDEPTLREAIDAAIRAMKEG